MRQPESSGSTYWAPAQFQCPNPPTSSEIFRHLVPAKIPVGRANLAVASQIQRPTNSTVAPHRTQEVGGSSPLAPSILLASRLRGRRTQASALLLLARRGSHPPEA